MLPPRTKGQAFVRQRSTMGGCSVLIPTCGGIVGAFDLHMVGGGIPGRERLSITIIHPRCARCMQLKPQLEGHPHIIPHR
jgi:hypothetical protein